MSVHELAIKKANNIEALRELLPDFAKDIRLNLSGIFKEDPNTGLKLNQIHGIALSAAYATRNQTIVDAVLGEAAATLSAEEINAAKAAATVMAMNNVYYRSAYMTGDDEFGRLPAGLRMNVIASPGIPKIDFELYSLAVSAINGCGACVQAHTKAVLHENLPKQAVQQAFKIGAVLTATAQALSI